MQACAAQGATCVRLERQGRALTYSLGGSICTAEVFRLAEVGRADCSVEEYGVTQSSLEQIFNRFAAQQDEEVAGVRGMNRAAPQEDPAGAVGTTPPATPPADPTGAVRGGSGAEEAEGAAVATVANPMIDTAPNCHDSVTVRRAALTAAAAEDDFEEEV